MHLSVTQFDVSFLLKPYLPRLLEGIKQSSDPSLFQSYVTCLRAQSLDDPEGRIEAVRKLNEENKEAVEIIAVFAKLRNLSKHRLHGQYPPGVAPIYKLPDELLSYIFSFLADGLPRITWNKPVLVNVPVIVTLSCVCRLWHSVVLDHTPELWSTISTTFSPKRLAKALDASKGARLDFHICFGPKTKKSSAFYEVGNEREQALIHTLAEMSRIRSLDVDLGAVTVAAFKVTKSRLTRPLKAAIFGALCKAWAQPPILCNN
ncbi:unnamed protein product [Peniophora sp. CBMAI 1063]|nr:unnamed protein product [Peniophora sp. CBMAI 1063]